MATRANKGYKRHDKINPDVKLHLVAGSRSFRTHVTDHPEDDDHPMVKFTINRPVGALDLTVMTEAELDALALWFQETIEMARPVVQELDRLATEAAAQGDNSYKRLWRPDPRYNRFD